MRPLMIRPYKHFIGRTFELEKLEKIGSAHEASIIVMYGRRRVGKTELLEQAFRERNILKFEGIGVNKTALPIFLTLTSFPVKRQFLGNHPSWL